MKREIQRQNKSFRPSFGAWLTNRREWIFTMIPIKLYVIIKINKDKTLRLSKDGRNMIFRGVER